MRLKSLELSGYKTFANKAVFEFAGTITAIVGPNGSGKSNIVDSLRWVLGEQSFSLLRGRKTMDMIFSGSEHRPRAGMASATVTFNNEDNWLPIDFSEVSIARRAYRDGDNEYLLNGQKVRLKDVSELLGTSGLAERTYTIVGQGLIDTTLSLKADERRKLFEEAAGIGLYRARREEALRRLETTQRNLERVADILEELKPRLRSLERQARRAQEYEQVKADLQAMLREWYGYHWHHAQRELKAARETATRQENTLLKARERHAQLEAEMATLRDSLYRVRARLNSWHRESAHLHERREHLSRELAVSAERQRAVEDQFSTLSQTVNRQEEELVLLQDRLEQATRETEQAQKQHAEAHQQLQEVRAALQTRQRERQQAERALEDARQNHARLTNRRASLAARQTELEARLESQRASLAAADKTLQEVARTLQTAEAHLEKATARAEQAQAARAEAQRALQTHRDQLTILEKTRQQMQETLSQRRTQVARLQAQVDVLEQAENALTGYAEGARQLLQAVRKEKASTRGALISQLEIPAELETAIAAALGDYAEGLLLEPTTPTETVLKLLEKISARAAVLPLAQLAPLPPTPAPPDALGNAADLVRVPAELRPVVDVLLGQTWLVRDRAGAGRLINSRPPAGVRIVTLAGELFRADGPIQAGAGAVSGTISRPRQRRELLALLETARGQVAESEGQLQGIEAELREQRSLEAPKLEAVRKAQGEEDTSRAAQREANSAIEAARKQHDWQAAQRQKVEKEIMQAEASYRQAAQELAQVDGELTKAGDAVRGAREMLSGLVVDDLQAQVAHWNTQAAVAAQRVEQLQNRAKERKSALETAQRNVRDQRQRLTAFQQELDNLDEARNRLREEEGKVGVQMAALQEVIQPAEKELDAGEKAQEKLQTEETDARQTLTVAERHHTQAQIGLARQQEALETLRRRIEDDFGLVAFAYEEDVAGPTPLPLSGMVEILPVVHLLSPELEEALQRQRTQLRRIGPINPDAQREYLEVKERVEFTTVQMADLQQADEDIRKVIAELDQLMQREFLKTFHAVAEEFKGIFGRLFGGGTAHLSLTNPDDIMNTGVEIEARLPGRRTQELSLLSGGERSLTASALIFSLLKVSPTPFCVLDEVDAMLDEANVHRFADLLRELSQKTQFIIITHNRNTVQVADTIYGITMGPDSTSQVLSLKLDEVMERMKELK
ncbi:MAG: chromosome segregation protein SMC [Anaerolineales bacterium]